MTTTPDGAAPRAATRSEQRLLLAALADRRGHIPGTLHPRVSRRSMLKAGWVTESPAPATTPQDAPTCPEYLITPAGRRAALTRPQYAALDRGVHDGGGLVNVPAATASALLRNGCAEYRDAHDRVTAERTGRLFVSATGRRAIRWGAEEGTAHDQALETPGGQKRQLTDLDRTILDLAGRNWPDTGPYERAMRERLDLSPIRFYQFLNALLDDPAALAYAPTTVNRLRRQRDERRATR